jgi:hypothetical protein
MCVEAITALLNANGGKDNRLPTSKISKPADALNASFIVRGAVGNICVTVTKDTCFPASIQAAQGKLGDNCASDVVGEES